MKNKKMGILVLFLLVVLVGCSQKNAEEMTIGEGSFHPDKNDEIVLEGSVSPKEIKYQVVDSNDKVILEGVTKNGLSDIKFKAPKKYDTFYTLKSGELEEEFYVYSVESENEIKKELETELKKEEIVDDKKYFEVSLNGMNELDRVSELIQKNIEDKDFETLRKSSVELLEVVAHFRTELDNSNVSEEVESSRNYLLTALNHYETGAILMIEAIDENSSVKMSQSADETIKANESMSFATKAIIPVIEDRKK